MIKSGEIILVSLISIIIGMILMFTVLRKSTVVSVYTSEDIYHVYPIKKTISRESSDVILKFTTDEQLEDYLHSKTMTDGTETE